MDNQDATKSNRADQALKERLQAMYPKCRVNVRTIPRINCVLGTSNHIREFTGTFTEVSKIVDDETFTKVFGVWEDGRSFIANPIYTQHGERVWMGTSTNPLIHTLYLAVDAIPDEPSKRENTKRLQAEFRRIWKGIARTKA